MTEWSKLAYIVEKIHQARVLVIGDVMLDRFIYGQISRISPEAPVPVLTYNETKSALGGAGNVVRNLSALGSLVSFISVVGPDDESQEIGSMLAELHGTAIDMVQEKGRKTIVKTRFIAGRQQVLRVDSESTHDISLDTQGKILSSVKELVNKCDVVILSDYGKGLLCGQVPTAVIDVCRKAGKMVLVDPKGRDYTRYHGASVITPNLKELHEATGMSVKSDNDVTAAARRIIDTCKADAVLATRSQDGMTLVASSGDIAHLRAEAKEVFDVSGAGDTVIAVTAAAASVGASLKEAAELANIAAGIVVGKVGTAVVYKRDLVHSLHNQEISNAEIKIMGLEEAADIVELWRRKGRKVGFTNGVFDLLHPGHISLLSQASKLCDRLIVGLNSDTSVKSIKGEDPIQHETARSAILASLGVVHAVVIYQEDTPLRALEILRPDILIKGANYSSNEVVGADFVRSYGGKVQLVNIENDQRANTTISKLTKGTL